MKRLPPFRYFLVVLATANAVMAGVIFLMSIVFSSGVNIVSITLVLLVVNVVGVVTVAREFRGSR
jgi:hypothetical protein